MWRSINSQYHYFSTYLANFEQFCLRSWTLKNHLLFPLHFFYPVQCYFINQIWSDYLAKAITVHVHYTQVYSDPMYTVHVNQISVTLKPKLTLWFLIIMWWALELLLVLYILYYMKAFCVDNRKLTSFAIYKRQSWMLWHTALQNTHS